MRTWYTTLRKAKKVFETAVHGIGTIAAISALMGTAFAFKVSTYWSLKLGCHLTPEIFSRLSIDMIIMTAVIFLLLFATPIIIATLPGTYTEIVANYHLNFEGKEIKYWSLAILVVGFISSVLAIAFSKHPNKPDYFFISVIVGDIIIISIGMIAASRKRIQAEKQNVQGPPQNPVRTSKNKINKLSFWAKSGYWLSSLLALLVAQLFAFIVYYSTLNIEPDIEQGFLYVAVFLSLLYPTLVYLLYLFIETRKFILIVTSLLALLFLAFLLSNIPQVAIINIYGGHSTKNTPYFYVGNQPVSCRKKDADYYSFKVGNDEYFALYCGKKLRYHGVNILVNQKLNNKSFANVYYYTECGSVWNNNTQSKNTLLCKSFVSFKKMNYQVKDHSHIVHNRQ